MSSIKRWAKDPVEIESLGAELAVCLLLAGVAVTTISQPVMQQLNTQQVASSIPSGNDFDKVMFFISKVEGGWSNHPADRGGRTKYGIIESVARRHGFDVASLTYEQAKQIYYKDYWIPSGAAQAQWPLNLAIMNSYLNSGRKWRIYGATPLEQAVNYIDQQTAHYHGIVARNPSQKAFISGWLRRSQFMIEAAKGGNPSW